MSGHDATVVAGGVQDPVLGAIVVGGCRVGATEKEVLPLHERSSAQFARARARLELIAVVCVLGKEGQQLGVEVDDDGSSVPDVRQRLVEGRDARTEPVNEGRAERRPRRPWPSYARRKGRRPGAESGGGRIRMTNRTARSRELKRQRNDEGAWRKWSCARAARQE